MPRPSAKVFLVGAGPGDPNLITLRGVQCLASADVVLYDYLANPALLAHAAPSASTICLGRHGRDRIMSQMEINELLVSHAQQGKTVVRLKGGDAAVFARLSEEVEALQAAGIDYEIVPGITAALAAGSYAGIPLTARGLASAVALITGHEQDDKELQSLDFEALARFPGTLVVYMGVTTARQWSESLIRTGKQAETPAAIVRRCSWPDQQTIRCTLATVADRIAEEKLRPPIVTIIGDVVAQAFTKTWFTERPLFGKRILITRPRRQAGKLWDLLSDLGAHCLIQPAIEIEPPADWSAVDDVLSRLGEFNWLVFSSANGVEFFFRRLLETNRDLRALGHTNLAAIGPGTADALRQYNLKADLQPEEYRAESLAKSLLTQLQAANVQATTSDSKNTGHSRLLLIRASRGREVLAETLTAAGFAVDQLVVYQSIDVPSSDPDIAAMLKQGQIDWITVTSSAIARSLARMFCEDLHRAKLASISPVTSETLRELGYEPAAEARKYTMEGIVEAITTFNP
jgi:uroporphyrinogen III methyltransferase/synthase